MKKPKAKRPAANSKKTAAPRGRPFKPGQSGNPNGRPKLSDDQLAARRQAQAILDAHTPAAAWAAVDLITHSDPKARAAGIANILDRSGLKGVDRLELTGANGGPVEFDLTKLTDTEARAFNAYLKKTAREKP